MLFQSVKTRLFQRLGKARRLISEAVGVVVKTILIIGVVFFLMVLIAINNSTKQDEYRV